MNLTKPPKTFNAFKKDTLKRAHAEFVKAGKEFAKAEKQWAFVQLNFGPYQPKGKTP